MESQIQHFLSGQTERTFPPNPEKEFRDWKFPEICFACKNVQCPYRRPENYGSPCKMRFEQYKNKYMQPNSKANPNEEFLRSLKINLTKALEKAFEPINKRLEAIENSEPRKPINRMLNGSEIPFRVDHGMNQTRIKNND